MIARFVAVYSCVLYALAGNNAWKTDNYPHLGEITARNRAANSVVDVGCGAHIGGADRLCDPDILLTREEAESIQTALVDIQENVMHACVGTSAGYQVAVALAKSIHVRRDAATAAESMARGLHDKWG